MCWWIRYCLVLAFAGCCAFSDAQDQAKKPPPRRFGYDVDEITFPQQSPDATMKSIATALGRKQMGYMLAQLADPAHVDYWVEHYKKDFTLGKEEGRRLLAFDRVIRDATEYLQNDPLIVKELRMFAKEAKWDEADNIAIGTVETIPARKVYLKKIGERWFLENKQQ